MDKLKPCEILCPKCGSSDIYREFLARGEIDSLTYGERDRARENKFISLAWGGESNAKKDCITHHCRCCQYEWETEPMEQEGQK
jgi:hypothetical protein